MINKATSYLKRILKDSTKRVVFVYIVIVILTPLLFIYTSKDNFEIVLGEILTFLSFLVGGGVYESIKKK